MRSENDVFFVCYVANVDIHESCTEFEPGSAEERCACRNPGMRSCCTDILFDTQPVRE